MAEVIDHPLKEEYSTRGSALNHGNSLVSGGSSKTSSDNGAKNLSKAVANRPTDPYYRELMEALEKATSFCDETDLKLTNLDNQDAEQQFFRDLYERCPNRGEKPIKDIVEVMIDVLHKYFIGFNELPIVGRKSYSGHGKSIMITCVEYLFGIIKKEQLVSAASLRKHEELTNPQCRYRIWNALSKGFKKKIMPAAELLTILDIELKSTTVKL